MRVRADGNVMQQSLLERNQVAGERLDQIVVLIALLLFALAYV